LLRNEDKIVSLLRKEYKIHICILRRVAPTYIIRHWICIGRYLQFVPARGKPTRGQRRCLLAVRLLSSAMRIIYYATVWLSFVYARSDCVSTLKHGLMALR